MRWVTPAEDFETDISNHYPRSERVLRRLLYCLRNIRSAFGVAGIDLYQAQPTIKEMNVRVNEAWHDEVAPQIHGSGLVPL
jgi:hypothetical protein